MYRLGRFLPTVACFSLVLAVGCDSNDTNNGFEIIENHSLELSGTGGKPRHWHTGTASGPHGGDPFEGAAAYQFEWINDHNLARSGKRALAIRFDESLGHELFTDQSGFWVQGLALDPAIVAGKALVLRGYVRAENAEGINAPLLSTGVYLAIYTYDGTPKPSQAWGAYSLPHNYANNVSSWRVAGGIRPAQGPIIKNTDG